MIATSFIHHDENQNDKTQVPQHRGGGGGDETDGGEMKRDGRGWKRVRRDGGTSW